MCYCVFVSVVLYMCGYVYVSLYVLCNLVYFVCIVFRVSCFDRYCISHIVFRVSCLIHRVLCSIFRIPVCVFVLNYCSVYLSLFIFISVFLYVCVCIYDSMCLICIWVNVSYLFSYVSISLYGGTFNKPANMMNFNFH